MEREGLLTKIKARLAFIKSLIELSNRSNEGTSNIHVENVFCRLMNEVFDLNLVNLNNLKRQSFPGLDLYDDIQKVGVQITAKLDSSKMKKTLDQIVKNENFSELKTQYFLVTTEKRPLDYYNEHARSSKEITRGRFNFNPEDNILDVGDLYNLIQPLEINKLRRISTILSEELPMQLEQEVSSKVVFIFSDNFLEGAAQIISELSELNVRIYVDSPPLEKRLKDKDRIIFFDGNIPEKVDYCITLLRYGFERGENGSEKQKKLISRVISQNVPQRIFSFGERVNWYALLDIPFSFKIKWDMQLEDVIPFVVNEIESLSRGEKLIVEYQNYLDVLKTYDVRAKFEELGRSSGSGRGVSYVIYSTTSEMNGKTDYFLCLQRNINQERTLDDIKRRFPKILGNDLIILLPKQKEQKDPSVRKKNIQQLFNPNRVYYVEDFIAHFCNPMKTQNRNIHEKYTEIDNFIFPYLKKDGQSVSYNEIQDWISSEGDPLMVLTGGGGIGKTTVARKIADFFLAEKPDAVVLFIESNVIKDELQKINELYKSDPTKHLDLYSFYEAYCALDLEMSHAKVTPELLKTLLDTGNLLIILDGLDEIISKIPDFDIIDLLLSIYEYADDQFNQGKVLVTCRTYFWDHDRTGRWLNAIEIFPFDEEMANQFFQMKFSGDSRKVDKGLRTAQRLSLRNSQEKLVFIPFVLDVVAEMVEDDFELLSNNEIWEGDNLLRVDDIDFIIYRICFREVVRIGQIPAKEQVKFFIHFSVFYDSYVSEAAFNGLFFEIFHRHFNDFQIEGFKSHTLLHLVGARDNRGFKFKYDFLSYFFKAIYLSKFIEIDSEESINEKILNILASDCQYSSILLDEVFRRVGYLNEDLEFRLANIIDQINEYCGSRGKDISHLKSEAKSGVLAIALKIKGNLNDKEGNTRLLRNLFASGGMEFSELSIINFKSGLERLIFDFRNMYFLNSKFKSFDNFWACEMDQSTYFENCTLHNLKFRLKTKILVQEENFRNCNTDEEFKNVFRHRTDEVRKIHSQISELLKQFFSMFRTNGRIQMQPYDRIAGIRSNNLPQNLFRVNKLINLLVDQGVLEVFYHKEHNEKKIQITDNYRSDVDKFCQQGFSTAKILKVVNILNEQTP